MNPVTTAERIIQSVCELQETPDLEHPETLVVSVTDLQNIIENKLNLQWMPIEAAPKDGSPILAAEDGYPAYVAEWFIGGHTWIGVDGHYLYPTHWMPLPAPPKPLNT